jgi:hypothetical protein
MPSGTPGHRCSLETAMKVDQHQLRHSSVRTTLEIYTHILGGRKRCSTSNRYFSTDQRHHSVFRGLRNR